MSIPAARLGDSFTDGDTIGTSSGLVFVNNMGFARLTDLTLGHSCWPPVHIISGSGNVFVENLPASGIGRDAHAIHCDTVCTIGKNPGDDCHDGIISSGSGNVFIG